MTEYRWNCVGLTTPDTWEPASLERDGFLLESRGRPVCEMKWRTVKGGFSFEKHLKKLAKGHKGVDMKSVPLHETPLEWRQGVARLTDSGLRLESFLWRLGDLKGIGAILHNPASGLAALIQFFMEGGSNDTAAEVLATFRDYSSGKTVPWAMFGLKARVPGEFVLDTFSFKPGHYQVKYWRPRAAAARDRLPPGKGPGTHLVFERFAPASVLLKGTTLEEWARAGLEDGVPDALPVEGSSDAIGWHGIDKPSLLRALLRRQRHSMGRVWMSATGNAILVVRTSGAVPLDRDVFKEVCESYAVL